MNREMICIVCPLGCKMTVTEQADGNLQVVGNTCKRGDAYARKEVLSPSRTLTATVALEGAFDRRLPVKTADEIPKGKMMEVMKALAQLRIQAPVSIGDVILADVCGTGVDVVATKDVISV